MREIKSQPPIFDKSLVQQSFDLASSSYNQFTALQRTIGDHLLDQQTAPLTKRALDIGAGTGYLTKKLADAGGIEKLYALDIAPAMLQQTRLNIGSECDLALICADAENLPLADASIDSIYSNVAYQWCSDLAMAFAEARRVLQQQGSFAFSTFGEKTLFELKQAWCAADQAVHVNSFFDAKTLKQYLQTAGFNEVRVISEDIVMYYETPKQLMLDLKGMGAHNMNKGRNLGLTGVSGFKKMLAAYESMRTDKGIPATFQALYGYARK